MLAGSFLRFGLAVMLVCTLGVGNHGRATTLEQLNFVTEELYPYNFTSAGRPTGMSVELLQLVFEELGSPTPEVTVLPWNRAYRMAQQVAGTALFSVVQTEGRMPLFHWACPIRKVSAHLFSHPDRPLDLTHVEQLSAYRIGAIRNTASDHYISHHQLTDKLHPLGSVEQMLELLERGRLDLIALIWDEVEDVPVHLVDSYQLFQKELCFAFHLATPQQEVERFQQALDALIRSGKYRELLAEYF